MKTNDQFDYAIYSSLLDAYLRFKRTDDDETFSAVFDKINGVKSEQTEQQAKGVAFESLVNDLIDGHSVYNNSAPYIRDSFSFKAELVEKIAAKLGKCKGKQQYISTIIDTRIGRIKLYGIIDFEFDDMDVDLKSTGNYKLNKYIDSKEIKHTQHLVYPLIRKQTGKPVKAFKYVISDFENDFQETYLPNENMEFKLMQIIYEFIAFINHYKANITDMKVFGGREVA
ncbi:MAG: hypothetical protein EOO85_08720 [Pedobacter sp.]|nr:MAG: hypothetical protein EOO85_08720 [Pedobacter sp.]